MNQEQRITQEREFAICIDSIIPMTWARPTLATHDGCLLPCMHACPTQANRDADKMQSSAKSDQTGVSHALYLDDSRSRLHKVEAFCSALRQAAYTEPNPAFPVLAAAFWAGNCSGFSATARISSAPPAVAPPAQHQVQRLLPAGVYFCPRKLKFTGNNPRRHSRPMVFIYASANSILPLLSLHRIVIFGIFIST